MARNRNPQGLKPIRAKGTFYKVVGREPQDVDLNTSVENPIGNGKWVEHRGLHTQVLCLATGASRGVWIRESDWESPARRAKYFW